jgi:hypothetical protein
MSSRNPNGRTPTPIEVRFWNFVPDKPSDECWEWTGRRNELGYGTIRETSGSRLIRAHRVSASIHLADYSESLLVCHHCDNPPCVNPSHLFMGTHRDNTLDGWEKGRIRKPPTPARKTHCPVGHEYTHENTWVEKNGVPHCRSCAAKRQQERRARGDRALTPPASTRTHCQRGHEYVEQNTWVDKYGYRHCRACNRERQAERRAQSAQNS